MTFLLDGTHVGHDLAHDWFGREGRFGWATCPITENGRVRIISQPKYPNGVSAPTEAMELLAKMTESPGHEFWPDELSITDIAAFQPSNLSSSGKITDSYLLALAVRRKGKLATLDRRLTTNAVHNGAANLLVLRD